MLRKRITHLVNIAFCPLIFSCTFLGGVTPEDRVGSLKHSKAYKVIPPSSWQLIENMDSDSAFKTPNGSIATLTSSCDRDAIRPLELLTKHLLIGARKIQHISSERMSVAGNEGQLSRVKAHLDDRPFDLLLFVTTYNGCIFDFSLVNPKAIVNEDVVAFRVFFRSLEHAH